MLNDLPRGSDKSHMLRLFGDNLMQHMSVCCLYRYNTPSVYGTSLLMNDSAYNP